MDRPDKTGMAGRAGEIARAVARSPSRFVKTVRWAADRTTERRRGKLGEAATRGTGAATRKRPRLERLESRDCQLETQTDAGKA